MDQLIPTLVELGAPFHDCFRAEVFQTFQALIAGWVVCLGPRTISAVWQATGLAARRHHDTAYAVFHSAVWEWDDLGVVLATLILARLVPGGVVWIVADDTLCHKRGAKVAFGGIYLDAVLSTRKHKTLRFGLNWVVHMQGRKYPLSLLLGAAGADITYEGQTHALRTKWRLGDILLRGSWDGETVCLHVERMALAIGDEQHVAHLRPSQHAIERTADLGAAARPAKCPHQRAQLGLALFPGPRRADKRKRVVEFP